MMKRLFSALLIASVLASTAQNAPEKCGENYVIETYDALHGKGSYELMTNIEESIVEPQESGNAEAVVYTIPVVFHIIYESEEDNISREQVLHAIRVLNKDYRRRNADTSSTRNIFKNVAADIEIEFQLAKKDPQGNCTDGITRTQSSLTVDANNNVKSLVSWPNKRYLNIWVVRSIKLTGINNVLGYAYKPVWGSSGATNSPTLDGIVIRHDQVGELGTGTATARGRTLVHEAGHYLGLDHPFKDGCFGGDGMTDTPPVASASYGCDTTKNSCTNGPNLPDQIENYMDYADDECQNMFTVQQRTRMRNRISSQNYRGGLITAANQDLTGITPNLVLPCAPSCDFEAEETFICEGESIQFSDKTFMGNPTSYSWIFPGGSPATSSDENPTVTYNQKGLFAVSLTTTNSSGNSIATRTGYISVRSQVNVPFINTYSDDFEAWDIPNDTWHVQPGQDTVNFRRFNKSAYNGQHSITLQNFHATTFTNAQAAKMKDELISHTILLSNSTSATLSFAYAFAEQNNNNNDKLRIYISDDCGDTWNLESQRVGALLRTTNFKIDTSWYPTMASQWKIASVDLASYVLSASPIMIKFEFENGGGNNFYLDDVLIATTIGEEELFNFTNISIYPNPADDVIQIDGLKDDAQIQIIDVTGRMVYQSYSEGNNEAAISIASLKAGIYMIRISQKGKIETQKLLVQ